MMAGDNSMIRAMAIALLAAFSPLHAQDEMPSHQTPLDPAAIVIFPVNVLSEADEFAQLAREVHEEFVDQLKAIEGLHIVESSLVKPYASSTLDSQEVARQLGAATALESSVSARSNSYEVRYVFIDVRTGKHYSNGSIQGREKWGPDSTLDSRVREFFSRIVESLETRLFPDRRTTDYDSVRSEAKAAVLNTGLSDRDRLKALLALQPAISAEHQGYMDDGLSLTGEVAIAAIQLASQSSDPFVRGSVWRTMKGVPDTQLVEPLLHALANDADARVRRLAAQALETHNGSAIVRMALFDAAKRDPDPDVRIDAEYSAAGPNEQWALLSKTAMNVTLQDSQRRYALLRLLSLNRKSPVPLESTFVDAMLQWVDSTANPELRQTIWSSLVRMVGAPITEALIEALSSDPSENTREALASILSRYVDEPGVREALLRAQVDDESPLVREAAKCSLQGGGWC